MTQPTEDQANYILSCIDGAHVYSFVNTDGKTWAVASDFYRKGSQQTLAGDCKMLLAWLLRDGYFQPEWFDECLEDWDTDPECSRRIPTQPIPEDSAYRIGKKTWIRLVRTEGV